MKRNIPLKVAVAVIMLAVVLTGAYFVSDPLRNFVNTQKLNALMAQLALKTKDDTAKHHSDSEAAPETPKPDAVQTSPKVQQESASTTLPESAVKTEITIKKVVEAKVGMNLSSLTMKYYNKTNETLIDYILELNPEITNPDIILINQQIKLPEITESLLIKKSPDGAFHVHLGTFPNARDAARYIEDNNLKEKNIEVVRRKVSRTEMWYRVLAGPFAGRDDALKFIEAIKQNGLLPSL